MSPIRDAARYRGRDPIVFGILIAFKIQTWFVSPPVAMAPFYREGIAPPHASINDAVRGVMPFLWLVTVMVMVHAVPGIGLRLPGVPYRSRGLGWAAATPSLPAQLELASRRL